MAIEFLYDGERACLICTGTGCVFGPLFSLSPEFCAEFDDVRQYVAEFLEWLPMDARTYKDEQLLSMIPDFEHWLRARHGCDHCDELCPKTQKLCDKCEAESQD